MFQAPCPIQASLLPSRLLANAIALSCKHAKACLRGEGQDEGRCARSWPDLANGWPGNVLSMILLRFLLTRRFVEDGANFLREFPLGVRFDEQVNVRVEPPLMDDSVAGIASGK